MKTVLVADDEFDLLRTLQAILEDEGYKVETFANGRQVLDRLPGEKPDLVLLDVMMPTLGGLDALREMKRTPGLDDIPVVLMSSIPPRVRWEDYRWDAFLRKPFSIDDLLKVVRHRTGTIEGASG